MIKIENLSVANMMNKFTYLPIWQYYRNFENQKIV